MGGGGGGLIISPTQTTDVISHKCYIIGTTIIIQ